MTALISVQEGTKIYGTPKNPIQALGPVDLEIQKGTFTVILGRSGSGKSTLLNLIAGLDRVSTGSITALGNDLSKASAGKLAKYRGRIGIIFQFYNLLANLNVTENILMGQWASGKSGDRAYATELMKKFGIDHRARANVKTLSGGEKQRVAICRALISKPEILFCDEPTGALDSQNELQVKDILRELHDEGLTIILVTHSEYFTELADRVLHMKDGQIIENIKTVRSLPAPSSQTQQKLNT
jgi:putative ABC transport system ATP-binding protein